MQQLVKDEYITVADAAQVLRVSTVTLHRWIKQGRLPAFYVGPRQIRIRRADLAKVVTPVLGEGVSTIKEIEPSHIIVEPLTDGEAEQGWKALKQADTLIETIRARRKGKPLADSAALIRRAREERSRQLLDL